jgi:hypothetical protein
MVIGGIDPGQKGGISIIDIRNRSIEIYPMPVTKYKNKTLICARGVSDIFRDKTVDVVYLERVWTRNTDGVVSAGNFMEGKGILLGVLAGFQIRVEQVTPQKWQSAMKCPATARQAVARGKELFPDIGHVFEGPRGGPKDGLAEASMIALYGCFIETKQHPGRLELKSGKEA